MLLFSPDAVSGWVLLIQKWSTLREAASVLPSTVGESWHRLPDDLRSNKWGVDHLNVFLARWLTRLGVVAPEECFLYPCKL